MPLLPKNRPLTLDDFRSLKRGTVVTLHYCAFNQGNFVWLHDRVQGDRVWGQFAFQGENFSDLDDYLYECDGQVCQGSGAEPLWAIMPPGEPADTLVNGRLNLPQKAQQPTVDPSLISQEYVFLYCSYDPKHGNRDWKNLLKSDLVGEIDLLVAQLSLGAGESETTVNEIIYYGSPAAQQMPHPTRGIYATSIVATAISSHSAN